MDHKLVQIPDRMAHLELDHRGYPIPWTVYRDENNRGHFQINDGAKRLEAIFNELCPICGKKLLRGRWFVGGPMSAFHERGAYVDPPMHNECARYALMVCPYLAVPHYGKRVEDKTLGSSRPTLLVDETMIERRPDLFISVMATRQHVTGNVSPRIIPGKPFVRVEYWRHGKQLKPAEGLALLTTDQLTWQSHLDTRRKHVKLIHSK